jgi:TolB-like protein
VRVVSLDTPKHTPAEAPHFKRVGSLLHLDEKIDIFASLIDVESGVQILAKRFSTDVEQDNISTALSTVSEIVSGPIEGQIGAVSHFFRTKWR